MTVETPSGYKEITLDHARSERVPLTHSRPVTFGQRLRDVREVLKLSRQDAAEKCGRNYKSWSRWEVSARVPTVENLAGIVKGLNLKDETVAWLVTGDFEEGRPPK